MTLYFQIDLLFQSLIARDSIGCKLLQVHRTLIQLVNFYIFLTNNFALFRAAASVIVLLYATTSFPSFCCSFLHPWWSPLIWHTSKIYKGAVAGKRWSTVFTIPLVKEVTWLCFVWKKAGLNQHARGRRWLRIRLECSLTSSTSLDLTVLSTFQIASNQSHAVWRYSTCSTTLTA
jgi:hypothetical protein